MNQRIRWWHRSRAASIRRTSIVLLTVCGLSLFVSGCADAGSTQASGPPSPIATASAPTATPKGGTILQTAAILGGSVFAFNNKFTPVALQGYGNGWTYQGPYGRMYTGAYTGDIANAADLTSTERAYGITNDVNRFGTWWTITQAKAVCAAFLPPDATYHKTTTVYFTGNDVRGFEQHYTSVSLANTLPASDFADVNSKATTPGTFVIYYDYTYNGNSNPLVDWCTLSTDESYAQPA